MLSVQSWQPCDRLGGRGERGYGMEIAREECWRDGRGQRATGREEEDGLDMRWICDEYAGEAMVLRKKGSWGAWDLGGRRGWGGDGLANEHRNGPTLAHGSLSRCP